MINISSFPLNLCHILFPPPLSFSFPSAASPFSYYFYSSLYYLLLLFPINLSLHFLLTVHFFNFLSALFISMPPSFPSLLVPAAQSYPPFPPSHQRRPSLPFLLQSLSSLPFTLLSSMPSLLPPHLIVQPRHPLHYFYHPRLPPFHPLFLPLSPFAIMFIADHFYQSDGTSFSHHEGRGMHGMEE